MYSVIHHLPVAGLKVIKVRCSPIYSIQNQGSQHMRASSFESHKSNVRFYLIDLPNVIRRIDGINLKMHF